jgi:hypothetical protein
MDSFAFVTDEMPRPEVAVASDTEGFARREKQALDHFGSTRLIASLRP